MTKRPAAATALLAITWAGVASLFAGTAAHAQADPCATADSGASTTRIDGTVSAPLADDEYEGNVVDVAASSFRYNDPFPDLDGRNVQQLDAAVIACAGQTLPQGASTTKSNQAEPMSLTWKAPALPWNGRYALTFTATAKPGDVKRTIVRPFFVAMKPSIPLHFVAASGSGPVSVSWDRNAEPDVAGYLVQWAKESDEGFADAKEVGVAQTAASVSRVAVAPDTGPGAWRFRVKAIRAGRTTAAGDLLSSAWSAAATGTVPTTSTTSAPRGGGATTSTSLDLVPDSSSSSSGTSSASDTGVKVDLSAFSAILDDRRRDSSTSAPKPAPEADGGFQPTLPFGTREQPAPAGSMTDGGGGVQTRVVRDDSGRRNAMGMVAGALLTFVVAMQVRWLVKEAERTDGDLDPTQPVDPDADADADDESTPSLTALDVVDAAAAV
ncbi:MAG TPA: hypothetical protein VF230_09850, partial [Acidimicrobiales bacterium]